MNEKIMCRQVGARKNKGSDGEVKIFALRKRVLLEAQMTPVQREHERRLASLGPGGCLACTSNPCQYNPILDPEVSLFLFDVLVIILIKRILGTIGRVQE